jgi:hypothetical protein
MAAGGKLSRACNTPGFRGTAKTWTVQRDQVSLAKYDVLAYARRANGVAVR